MLCRREAALIRPIESCDQLTSENRNAINNKESWKLQEPAEKRTSSARVNHRGDRCLIAPWDVNAYSATEPRVLGPMYFEPPRSCLERVVVLSYKRDGQK